MNLNYNAILKQFIPAEQLKVAEGSNEFDEILFNLANLIIDMPSTKEQDGLGDYQFVFLHYFSGSSDWYVTEKDAGDPEHNDFAQSQAFGFGILNDDTQNAEMSEIPIDGEHGLTATKGVELDFHFVPTPLKDIKEMKGISVRLPNNLDAKKFNHVLNIAEKYGYENEANKNDLAPVPTDEDLEIYAERLFSKSPNAALEIEFGKLLMKHINNLTPDEKKRYNELEAILHKAQSSADTVVVDEITSAEPDTDTMKMLDGWVKFQKAGTIGIKIKKKFEFDNAADAEKAFADMKQYSVSPAVLDVNTNSFAITARDSENTKDLIKGIYDKIVSQKPKQVDTIEESKPEPKDSIAPDPKAQDVQLGMGKSRNENLKAIQNLIVKNGVEISKYSLAELAYLRTYQGVDHKGLQQYFPNDIVQKMWGLAYKHGFNSSQPQMICEPNVGIGNYLEYAPDNSNVDAYTDDYHAYTISKLTFPKFNVLLEPFENILYADSKYKGLQNIKKRYDLFIGLNIDSKSFHLADDFGSAKTKYQYVMLAACKLLKVGGLMVFLVPATFMNDKHDFNEFKEKLLQSCTLLDAYRLPESVMEESQIVTDIIVLKKIK
jgi:hypothetical protein